MSATLANLDNKSVKSNIKNQLRAVRKNNISSMDILGELAAVGLNDVYSIIRQSMCELTVKIDKKTKIDEAQAEIRGRIASLIDNKKVDVDILFRITVRENEITIQAKRYNEQ
jgi:hypothetical protein